MAAGDFIIAPRSLRTACATSLGMVAVFGRSTRARCVTSNSPGKTGVSENGCARSRKTRPAVLLTPTCKPWLTHGPDCPQRSRLASWRWSRHRPQRRERQTWNTGPGSGRASGQVSPADLLPPVETGRQLSSGAPARDDRQPSALKSRPDLPAVHIGFRPSPRGRSGHCPGPREGKVDAFHPLARHGLKRCQGEGFLVLLGHGRAGGRRAERAADGRQTAEHRPGARWRGQGLGSRCLQENEPTTPVVLTEVGTE